MSTLIKRKQAFAILVISGIFDEDTGDRVKIPRPRSMWVRDWLLRRDEKGAYANILQELKVSASGEHLTNHILTNQNI